MRDNGWWTRMLLIGDLFIESGDIEMVLFVENGGLVYDDFGVV